MQFARKRTIINAEQFIHPATAPRGVYVNEDGSCYVVDAHGHRLPVNALDWIVEEPLHPGKFYRIDNNTFNNLYEPI